MGEAERGRTVTTRRIALAALLVLAVFWVVAKNGSRTLPPPAPITLKDEVQNLAAGGWKAFPFYTSGGELNIDLRVVHGNPIDVFLTPGDQLDPMKRGDWAAVKTIAAFDATRTATYRRTGSLGVGDYQLVVRDTTLGILSARASDIAVKMILTPWSVPAK